MRGGRTELTVAASGGPALAWLVHQNFPSSLRQGYPGGLHNADGSGKREKKKGTKGKGRPGTNEKVQESNRGGVNYGLPCGELQNFWPSP